MAKNYDDIGGVWRTIGGRRVFIKTGQSLSDAMKESGKFKTSDVKREEYHKAKAEHEVMESQKKVLENKNPDMSDKLHKKYNEARKKNKELEMLYEEPDAWKYEGDVSKLKGKHINKELSGEEYLKNYDYERNMPEGAKFNKMLEENNVRTFADDIKEREQRGIKEISYIGQDNREHKMNSYDYPKDRKNYHKYLEDNYGTYKEEEIIKKDNSLSYAKLRNEFYDKQDRIKKETGYETYLRDTQGTTNEKLINVGREKENRVDYQKYKDEVIRNINKKRMEKGTTSLEQAYKKAFEEYKKQHPNTKLNLKDFIKMSEE